MNGSNVRFANAPEAFISSNVVNTVRWLQEAGNPKASVVDRMRVQTANLMKEATFDLVKNETSGGMDAYDFTLSQQIVSKDVPLTAYWCPFYQGNTLPGFVDIPRYNPEHRFVFTPAMNGCAFVVTYSPKGAGWLRVYHHHHPGSLLVENKIRDDLNGNELISIFSFDEYGLNDHPNAFNFMYYRNSRWLFVSQPQTLNMATREVGFRPAGKMVIKDAV